MGRLSEKITGRRERRKSEGEEKLKRAEKRPESTRAQPESITA